MHEKQYVLGFAFSKESGEVALILKNRPAWQQGRLNGIGGKIEPGERLQDAMVREFSEETGVATTTEEWTLFGDILEPEATVYMFRVDLEAERFSQLSSMTDETVMCIHPTDPTLVKYALPNVPGLIAMAAPGENWARGYMSLSATRDAHRKRQLLLSLPVAEEV